MITKAEFDAAASVISSYINHPESGWDGARYLELFEIVRQWALELEANRQHAADDAEKELP